jgi:hypothetical protein
VDQTELALLRGCWGLRGPDGAGTFARLLDVKSTTSGSCHFCKVRGIKSSTSLGCEMFKAIRPRNVPRVENFR